LIYNNFIGVWTKKISRNFFTKKESGEMAMIRMHTGQMQKLAPIFISQKDILEQIALLLLGALASKLPKCGRILKATHLHQKTGMK
jgi:hypothetical protein